MPARRRFITANKSYEICFRARAGLPLPPNALINRLIKSALSRTQRDSKVVVCHYQWMANHAHFLVVAKDAGQCVKFYMEIQKKLTDYLKRILGESYLDLWEGDVTVSEIVDTPSAIRQISYFYLNPLRANLVRTVEESPALSSWKMFLAGKDSSTTFSTTEECTWVRQPSLCKLASRSLDERKALRAVEEIIEKNPLKHELTVYPNAWMETFGITKEEEVLSINREILAIVSCQEEEIQRLRIKEQTPVLGPKAFREVPILKAHIPKKKGSKIFFMAATRERAIEYLARFRCFCEQCRQCFLAWRRGELTVEWPPGAFIPQIPPLANAVV